MAPQFHEAFTTPKDGKSHPPPGPTSLLKDTPRVCLIPAQHALKPAPEDPLMHLAFTPNDVIELGVSHPGPTLTAKDSDIAMDIDDRTTYHTILPSTTLPDAAYHCTNLFDLVIVLRRLTSSQRQSIHTFKIRWYTAECVLWEYFHPDHASHVSSSAFEMLTGLRKVVVDCEGKGVAEMKEMKGELEWWTGGVVEMEMVGGEKEVKKEKWWEHGRDGLVVVDRPGQGQV